MINYLNDLFAELVEVKNRRICVETNRMELIAVLKSTKSYLDYDLAQFIKSFVFDLFVLILSSLSDGV